MNYILRNIVLLLASSLPVLAAAQDFSSILKSIEANSTALQSARMKTDASAAELDLNKRLDDPELGVNYLWGSNDVGNRLDLNVTQSFDLPMVYAQRRNLVNEQKRVLELNFLSERQQLLLQAKKLCIQVVYCNAIMDHLDEDLVETQAMADAYQKLFDKGEATIIDRNKAKQAFLFFEAEYREFKTMRQNLLNELRCLNGGVAVEITDSAFVHTPLPADVEQWITENMSENPSYQACLQKVKSEEDALAMARKECWPKLKVGYMSEKSRDEHYQGITAGLSLPVWSAAKKTKLAKAHIEASKMEEKDVQLHVQTQLRGIYAEAQHLEQSYQTYNAYLKDCDNSDLLMKSLNAGQITLLTYLQELQYVHEMHERALAAERDFELRKAELYIIP